MKPEKTVFIKEKLVEIGVELSSISLGSFDYIGEATVKKMRDPNSELFHKVGAFFKPNQERGLLIYSLIKQYKLDSYLEVGLGRGFSALCAARAFSELGNDGKVMVIENSVDDAHMSMLGQAFPPDWTQRIQVAKGRSQDVIPKLQDTYQLVYIDGDHTKEAVRSDWEGLKDRWSCFCLLDDWLEDKGTDPAIQVHEALEEAATPDGVTVELVKMDRRVFLDDRQWPDDKIRYGQLLLTRPAALEQLSKQHKVAETWDW